MFDEAERHFQAALTGAEHFNIKDIYWHLYCNFSHLCFNRGDLEECIRWTELALKAEGDPLLPAANYVEVYAKLGNFEKCKKMLDSYLVDKHKDSKYYKYLNFIYLSTFHLNDELFYREVTQKVLPFYEEANHFEICNVIKLKLIEHLENRRKYKEANKIYRDLIEKSYIR
jgi:tetratricopeptide (TPR) repeat protein